MKAQAKIFAANPLAWLAKKFDEMAKTLAASGREKGKFAYVVMVAGRADSPGPRDPMWEMILDLGRTKIQDVLDRKPIGVGPHYFVFPDRWLTPPEAMSFRVHLEQNPDAYGFKIVGIVTHQPYLVGDCFKEQCCILTRSNLAEEG